jgi:hypothetical protein
MMTTEIAKTASEPKPLASSFKDCTGREWNLRITLGIANRLREAKIVDLLSIFQKGMQEWEAWLRDPLAVGKAVVCICEKQGEAANLTPDDLFENLDGPAIDAMIKALQVSVAEFYPNLRRLILAGMEKGQALQAETEAKALDALAKWDPAKIADAAGERVTQELDNLATKIQVGPSSSPSGPAPSASTPNP